MSGRPWGAGDVAAIMVNPIYAIEIHPSFGRPHEHMLSEANWMSDSAALVSAAVSFRA